VFKVLGNFPSYLTHALGDCDYSRRAVSHGISVYLSPRFVGVCEKNMRVPAWKNPRASMVKRFQSLYSPTGGSEPLVLFRYCLRHDGLPTAVKLLITNHIRAIYPKFWL
jgi:GT2 family glycosyltransferase